MRLLDLPSRQGALWVRRGIAVFLRAPLPYLMLMLVMLLAVPVLAVIPVIGAVVLIASAPLVSLGFMIATREVLEGNPRPMPTVFIDPLRTERPKVRAMLMLCSSYAVLVILTVVLSNALSGGRLAQLGAGSLATPEQVEGLLAQPGVPGAILLCATMMTLLSLAYWHAPALVYWDGQGASQAVFSSTLACWRNRGAFTIYGLAWIGLITLLNWVTVLVVGVLLNSVNLAALLLAPLGVASWAAFYASAYFSFADSFIDTVGDAHSSGDANQGSSDSSV